MVQTTKNIDYMGYIKNKKKLDCALHNPLRYFFTLNKNGTLDLLTSFIHVTLFLKMSLYFQTKHPTKTLKRFYIV